MEPNPLCPERRIPQWLWQQGKVIRLLSGFDFGGCTKPGQYISWERVGEFGRGLHSGMRFLVEAQFSGE